MEINIGINAEDREEIAGELSKVLADTSVLNLKTHNYHWNVTGELFYPLHQQFEEQYNELAEAIDEIAERIRALGFRAPGTLKEYQKLTSVKEDSEQPGGLEMVRRLALAHEKVAQTVRSAMARAEEVEDEATADLLTERLHVHAETAWMLRSHLE